MSYQSTEVASVIKWLNESYYLPAIQREFVWEPDQIIRLFDSLLMDYPIQSFLFWELDSGDRDRWDIYKFIDNFSQKDPHNQPANAHGVQRLTLVLDGQQRLTSLLIGLKGSYTVKKKGKWRTSPDAWSRQVLYLDLFKDPDDDEATDELGLRYGFQFKEAEPQNDKDHYWFRVGRILDCSTRREYERIVAEEKQKLNPDSTIKNEEVFRKTLAALYDAIWKNSAISYRTETGDDLDRVLDVFVRVNEGGTKLSKSDLLLSTVTAHWTGINAREEIYGFVDRINNDLQLRNNFDKDFVMKACLVLTDLEVQYKVDNFKRQNLALIQNQWITIRSAVEAGARLVNSFGIDRESLTSANALIPVIYYIYHHQGIRLGDSSQFAAKNRQAILQWLAGVLLNGAFGRATDTVLRNTRRVLKDHVGENDFPLQALSAATGLNSDTILNLVLDCQYTDRTTFLALALLYEDTNWASRPHKDHIFPQDLFKPPSLRDAGIPADQHEMYMGLRDGIGNLELLLDRENTQKSAQPFEEWIKTRDASFRTRQLIPDDASLYSLSRFPDFIEARETLIKRRLSELFAGI